MLELPMSFARRLERPATLEDLESLPANVKGEILDGVLYTMPRPRAAHQHVIGSLAADLLDPFGRGRSGPGGWWILVEPGIALPEAAEVSPDLAGWRRERLPSLPKGDALRLVPDWICEVLSPSSRAYDRRVKMPFYAQIGVAYAWIVDPEARTLEVKKLEQGRYVDLAVFAEEEPVRAEPFEAVELGLGPLWDTGEPPLSAR